MHDAVMSRLPRSEVVVGAAAPADYAPMAPASRKVKKARQSLALELRPTPDILAECGRRKRAGQVLVGFAAETQHVMANARAKLKAKKLDMIVANDVSREGIGFEADQNAGHLLLADGRKIELPRMAKSAFAERVMEVIGEEAKRGKRRARLRR
jgi:phosphopantothenoylcysteine decarboxylase/phosphopantothenate--cysteine ligase